MKKNFLLALLFLFIQGCATQKTLQFLDGSRVDGLVTLGFDYKQLEMPQWSTNQGLQQAERICKGWGYKGASWLVNDQSCNYRSNSRHRIGNTVLNINECVTARFMVKYQCTSQSNETPNKPALLTAPPSAVSTTQAQPAQSVVEQSVPIYQQPQSEQSGTDLRYCLSLIDNKDISECVKKAKK